MATVEKKVAVSKELSEVMDAVVGIVAATKEALADGFQPGADLPAVVAAAFAKLPAAVAGVESIAAELAEDRAAAFAAVNVGALELAALWLPAAPEIV